MMFTLKYRMFWGALLNLSAALALGCNSEATGSPPITATGGSDGGSGGTAAIGGAGGGAAGAGGSNALGGAGDSGGATAAGGTGGLGGAAPQSSLQGSLVWHASQLATICEGVNLSDTTYESLVAWQLNDEGWEFFSTTNVPLWRYDAGDVDDLPQHMSPDGSPMVGAAARAL